MGDRTPYQICTRCVMDSYLQEIVFDSDGVCNFCHEYDNLAKAQLLPEREAEHKLSQIIAKIKEAGRGKQYDCVLGLSGGVDSSYLACKLKEFGLRVLAVQFDNGWNSELAVKNIELICKKSGIDLYTYVVDWEEFRDLQLAFFRASEINLELPSDHGIIATLFRVADNYRIKYIISGVNIVTEGINVPISYGHRQDDWHYLRSIHKKYGKIRLSTFPRMGLFKYLYYKNIKNIKAVSLLNYMPYNKAEAMEILENKYGWQYYGGKHFESLITRFHQTYYLIKKCNLDKRRAHLSNLIYSGQMTRDEALKELESPPCPAEMVKESVEYFIKKMNLTKAEFEELMAISPNNGSEFHSDDDFLPYKLWHYAVKLQDLILSYPKKVLRKLHYLYKNKFACGESIN